MAKAAFLETLRRSGSAWIIFWTRATIELMGTMGSLVNCYLRGRDTWPVISLEGSIGVLLYGMFALEQMRGDGESTVSWRVLQL